MLKNIGSKILNMVQKSINPEAYAAKQADMAAGTPEYKGYNYQRLFSPDILKYKIGMSDEEDTGMKKGGKVKKKTKGGSASKRADGIAQRGKTRGRIV